MGTKDLAIYNGQTLRQPLGNYIIGKSGDTIVIEEYVGSLCYGFFEKSGGRALLNMDSVKYLESNVIAFPKEK